MTTGFFYERYKDPGFSPHAPSFVFLGTKTRYDRIMLHLEAEEIIALVLPPNKHGSTHRRFRTGDSQYKVLFFILMFVRRGKRGGALNELLQGVSFTLKRNLTNPNGLFNTLFCRMQHSHLNPKPLDPKP